MDAISWSSSSSFLKQLVWTQFPGAAPEVSWSSQVEAIPWSSPSSFLEQPVWTQFPGAYPHQSPQCLRGDPPQAPRFPRGDRLQSPQPYTHSTLALPEPSPQPVQTRVLQQHWHWCWRWRWRWHARPPPCSHAAMEMTQPARALPCSRHAKHHPPICDNVRAEPAPARLPVWLCMLLLRLPLLLPLQCTCM